MKLDIDLIREILLEIEERTTLDTYLSFDKVKTDPNKFYTLIKLKEARYINSRETSAWGGIILIRVYSLTWLGHEFLDNIRSPKVIEHTKSVLKEFGSFSLNIISQVASAYIKSQLGL